MSSLVTILVLIKSQYLVEMGENQTCNKKQNGLKPKIPFLIGVAGGPASGKSTICKIITDRLSQGNVDETRRQVVHISQDSFYHDLTTDEIEKANICEFNFDHPAAFNEELMETTLNNIMKGRKCDIPVYDYQHHKSKDDEKITVDQPDVVLFEGILVLYSPKVRNLCQLKLFLDTDADSRLAQRIPRDINERGRSLDLVIKQHMLFKPTFEEFCETNRQIVLQKRKILNKLPREIKSLPLKKLRIFVKSLLQEEAFYGLDEYLNHQ